MTQNDAGDTDLANNLQNYPILNLATTGLAGTLNSTPNRTFRLEFYASLTADPTGYGEGKTYFNSVNVTTDGFGNAVFALPNPQPLGSYISATATDLTTNDTSEFSPYKQTTAPTAVKFAGATAKAFDDGVLLEWQTGMESDNLGFNIYRERGGKRELVSQNLIAGSALMTEAQLLSGQNYSWFDAAGDGNSAYLVEAVDLNGATELYGAFSAAKVFGNAPENFNSPALDKIGVNSGSQIDLTKQTPSKITAQNIANQNIIAQNGGVKIKINRAGFYRVATEELFAGSLPQNANPANLRLFADGIEQPINILTENNQFAGIEFYGRSADTAETSERVYYLAESNSAGLRMAKFDQTHTASTATSFQSTIERRDRSIYFSGLLNGDAENFFGAVVNNAGANQNLTISGLAAVGETARLEIKLQGVTRNAHSVRIELNGANIGAIDWNEMAQGTATIKFPANNLREGENTIRLTANNSGDVSLVDFVRLTYPRRLQAENNALALTADGERETTVRGFTTANVRIFDVTDANAPFELAARIVKERQKPIGADDAANEIEESNAASEIEAANAPEAVNRNYTVSFAAVGSGRRDLIAVSAAAQPVSIVADVPSNLRDSRGAADLLILTRGDFVDELEPLAALRRQQGLTVQTIDVENIYDEFSFGRKSAAAIKEFLNFANTNWRKKPQFVLLAGDATYDPKGYVFASNADVVQTKLLDAENMETASDEWFVDFDGDDAGEIAVGRLPAKTAAEMRSIVGKLLGYERQTPRNSAAFVADASDGYDFAAANMSVRALLPNSLNFVEIVREADNTTTAKTALLNSISEGQTLVHYTGHGAATLWRGNLLTTADANALRNIHLPVFVMMNCLNGYFTNAQSESLSESLLKNPNGGAAAVWASAGTTQPDSQVELHRAFVRALFEGGSTRTIGQAAQIAKRSTSNTTIRRTWTFFGDPSMRLR